MSIEDRGSFYAEWPLGDCRQYQQLEPAAHQATALSELHAWYAKRPPSSGAGSGILVMPTGGGKTITAVRFLAAGPLSDGFKILWLAHTHHLLEQAFKSFRGETLGSIREPRRDLKVRVVSGTPGHFPPRDIRPTDDVVIGTLQTITTAVNEELGSIVAFLREAGKKLFVVFDEAHHAPAPSYRKLLQGLQASSARVLGLTATPMHSDESKQGWLKKLFPDGIIAQCRANALMAAGILARPHAVQLPTSFVPTFAAREYEQWIGTFKDLPEHVIDELANSAERNAFIARTYADRRKEFGKTIIFTDRWVQCEAIAESLAKLGVKAGSVYSHLDMSLPTVAQRARRDRDENARVLERFRKNEIDVLINVRMLTEGTDIPDAQTVFLTRQTTSRILLTQMVGRALRGPKFGGTTDAYIVSFEDDWRAQIQWAGFELVDGGTDERSDQRPKRPPLQLISIDLVKKLARQMDGGINVAPAPFQTLLPLGWYRTQFDARGEGADDVEPMDLLVMVYDDERAGFEKLVAHLVSRVPEALADEAAGLAGHEEFVALLRSRFLGDVGRGAADMDTEIFQIARHVAQRGTAPQFFRFEVRTEHDLDTIVSDHTRRDLGPRAQDDELRAEYARDDRFWHTLFTRFEQLRHYYDGCMARQLAAARQGVNPEAYRPPPKPMGGDQKPSPSEPDEAVKEEVFARDRRVCLACGARKYLQADHVIALYNGGTNDPGNLQTLCRQCNNLKRTRRVSFRTARSTLTEPPAALPDLRLPDSDDAANADQWERFLRRTINFFYQCSAVGEVAIAGKGDGYYNWVVTLRSGNPAAWLKPHLSSLLAGIQGVRDAGGKPLIKTLRVKAPGETDLLASERKAGAR